MNLGDRITQLRKEKGWSQSELAKRVEVSREIIGRYERNDANPSIDVVKRMAEAFEVSLDNIVGEGLNVSFDKKTVQRLKEIQELDDDNRHTLFKVIDAYLRDYKTRKAYES